MPKLSIRESAQKIVVSVDAAKCPVPRAAMTRENGTLGPLLRVHVHDSRHTLLPHQLHSMERA